MVLPSYAVRVVLTGSGGETNCLYKAFGMVSSSVVVNRMVLYRSGFFLVWDEWF